jgi:hypothetical protein
MIDVVFKCFDRRVAFGIATQSRSHMLVGTERYQDLLQAPTLRGHWFVLPACPVLVTKIVFRSDARRQSAPARARTKGSDLPAEVGGCEKISRSCATAAGLRRRAPRGSAGSFGNASSPGGVVTPRRRGFPPGWRSREVSSVLAHIRTGGRRVKLPTPKNTGLPECSRRDREPRYGQCKTALTAL